MARRPPTSSPPGGPGVGADRFGFALRDPLSWPRLVATVRSAERAGYGTLFLPEIEGRDALLTLGMLAGETSALRLGTGVVPMRSRTPFLTAMAAATVQERSDGRLVLGLGTGSVRRGALRELREEVGVVRALLGGEAVQLDGRTRRLSLPVPAEVPIWISAMGERSMRLAGELADGVLLNWCTPERVALARERIAEGAAAAGRDAGAVLVGVYVRSWVGDDVDAATTALRAAAGEYASYPAYARQFDEMGLGDEATAAAAAFRAGRPDEVPEVLPRAVAAFGSTASETLAAFRRAGADLPIVYPVPVGEPAASIDATLAALAPGPGVGPAAR